MGHSVLQMGTEPIKHMEMRLRQMHILLDVEVIKHLSVPIALLFLHQSAFHSFFVCLQV